jgi:hypothetical protein
VEVALMLTTREHQTVQRQTREQRTAAARSRRAAQPNERERVVLIEGTGDDGRAYRLAYSPKDASKAYFVTVGSDGAARCSCFTFAWQGYCAHAAAATRPPRLAAPGGAG